MSIDTNSNIVRGGLGVEEPLHVQDALSSTLEIPIVEPAPALVLTDVERDYTLPGNREELRYMGKVSTDAGPEYLKPEVVQDWVPGSHESDAETSKRWPGFRSLVAKAVKFVDGPPTNDIKSGIGFWERTTKLAIPLAIGAAILGYAKNAEIEKKHPEMVIHHTDTNDAMPANLFPITQSPTSEATPTPTTTQPPKTETAPVATEQPQQEDQDLTSAPAPVPTIKKVVPEPKPVPPDPKTTTTKPRENPDAFKAGPVKPDTDGLDNKTKPDTGTITPDQGTDETDDSPFTDGTDETPVAPDQSLPVAPNPVAPAAPSQ